MQMSLAASICGTRRRLMRCILPQMSHAAVGILICTSTKFLYRMTLVFGDIHRNVRPSGGWDVHVASCTQYLQCIKIQYQCPSGALAGPIDADDPVDILCRRADTDEAVVSETINKTLLDRALGWKMLSWIKAPEARTLH